jgi:ADP-ribose pyrophosphatase YjhB (NUDIX family)
MKEYRTEQGKRVDLSKLRAEPMAKDDYAKAHEGLVIPCHDVFIEYNGGILLIKRHIFPAINILWPLGGRIQRGMPIEDSLRKKIWDEAHLRLDDIQELGVGRTFWETAPFPHGRGTDTMNVVFYARGRGELKLDMNHDEPTIVLPHTYKGTFRRDLHPYVREYMDKSVPLIGRTTKGRRERFVEHHRD